MSGLTMDVFKGDAFSAQNLTTGIDRKGYTPTLLGQIPGLFVPPPLGQPTTKAIFVEERDNEPVLIQTSLHGAEPDDGRTDEKTRKVTPFAIPRLFRKRRIVPNEIAGIREYASVTVMQSLDSVIQRKQFLIQNDISLTWENMRLGAVLGTVKDADGSTIYNYSTTFGQSIPGEATWVFPAKNADNDGTVSGLVAVACRSMTKALKGMGGVNVTFHALCGDSFYDALRGCAEVRETVKYTQGELLAAPRAWRQIEYGGCTFYNYRGTDDGTTVAIGAKKAKFFPAGAGIFQEVYAPADDLGFEFIGTNGQPAYSWVRVDPLRNAWADVEMASYPLFMCLQPSALYQAAIA